MAARNSLALASFRLMAAMKAAWRRCRMMKVTQAAVASRK
jgi:hypothetical protein